PGRRPGRRPYRGPGAVRGLRGGGCGHRPGGGDLLHFLLPRLPAEGGGAMNTVEDRGHGCASEAVAVAAERRWAIIVGLITVLLVAMMVFTGLHWAAMPPSRVETVDVNTLHTQGEFVESNLGTTLGPDGKVVVRLIAQQYSFVPQCI